MELQCVLRAGSRVAFRLKEICALRSDPSGWFSVKVSQRKMHPRVLVTNIDSFRDFSVVYT